MNTSFSRQKNDSGLTVLELVVIVAAIAILIALALPYFSHFTVGRPPTRQLGDGRQLYLSLRNYSSDMDHAKEFPAYSDPENRSGLFRNSNEVFQSLIPRYLDGKELCFNKRSKWCTSLNTSKDAVNFVLPGENDWCYVRGLRDDSPAKWPLLANAFAPGTTRYVKDPAKRGGVWKGTSAVVVWAGGAAEIVETKGDSGTFFVKRADKPSANAFEKAADWLTGENVELLYPIPPK